MSRFHPSFRTLSAYCEGELRDRRQARVARHLEACGSCRRTVTWIRGVGAFDPAAGEHAPEAAWLRLLARRQGGERIILPVDWSSSSPAPSVPARRVRVAAVAAFAMIVGLIGTNVRAATLVVTAPAMPDSEDIVLAFRPGARASLGDSVVLRAHFLARKPGCDGRHPEGEAAAVLRASGDGQYRGSVPALHRTSYAVLAVEDGSGQAVAGGGPWPVLVRETSSRDGCSSVGVALERLPGLTR